MKILINEQFTNIKDYYFLVQLKREFPTAVHIVNKKKKKLFSFLFFDVISL